MAAAARLRFRAAPGGAASRGRGRTLISRVERVRARIGTRIAAARAIWPWFDHAVRAYRRNNEVLGSQLAAAISYYGFLSFFPLLALAFAVVGYISGAYPDAQDSVTRALQDSFPSLIGPGSGQINVKDIIDAKAGAGVIGLVGLFYTGLGWLDALRAALRRVFGTTDVPLNFVKKKAVDVVVLIGLGLALLASLVVTGLATAVTRQVLGAVGVDDKLVAVALLKVLSVALALLADTALFAILLSRLSGAHQTWRQVRTAAFLGAVGFELLKLAGTFLIVRTTNNPVYATFGVVAGLLIWINLVSQLLMFVAAWAATSPPYPAEAAPVAPTALLPPAAAAGGSAPDSTPVASSVAGRHRRWRLAVLGGATGAAVVAVLSRRKRGT
jgi:membrane protein